MPDKPIWLARLNTAIPALEALSDAWIDRSVLEFLLGIGRRRAQQILQPLVTKKFGSSGVARKDDVIAHLKQLAAGEEAYFEHKRREKLAAVLKEAQAQTRLLVETPLSVVNQRLQDLPDGVILTPGRIVIEGFRTAPEALQKMLALAYAAANEEAAFEQSVTMPDATGA